MIEEVDAISEADLYLNFGRDKQAEDVLKEALRSNPSNTAVQLKLLGIYANRKDVNAFTSIARQVKDSGDAAAWEQAAALGRAVDASNPMYATVGGAAVAAAAAALAESGKAAAVPLDMDIGFNIPMDLDVTAATPALDVSAPGMDFDVSGYVAATPAMDLDVTSEHAPVAEALLPDFDVTGGHPTEQPAQTMDFDVTGSHPNVTAIPGMDFDVTGSHPMVTAAPTMDFDVTAGHPVTETQLMDFDVTGSHPNIAAAAPGQAMSSVVLESPLAFEMPSAAPAPAPATEAFPGLGAMDFDLGAVSAAPEAPVAAEAPEAPSGLGALDFDINPAPSAQIPAAEPEAPLGLGGLDFDISSGLGAAAPAAPAAEEPAGLGGLDFDVSSGLRGAAPAAEAPSGLGAMDFDLSAPSSVAAPAGGGLGAMDFDVSVPHPARAESPEPTMDLSGISLNLAEAGTMEFQPEETRAEEAAPESADEVANKLELAIAFQNMGDMDTARELLGEVLKEGNPQQIEAARAVMQQL